MTLEVPIAARKGRIAPIEERYQNGEYQEVETVVDGVRRVAVCTLSGEHNRDYRVQYASDPVIILHTESPGVTHGQLQKKMLQIGICAANLREVEIPTGSDCWLAGYATGTREQNRLDRFKDRISNAALESGPVKDGETSMTAVV